MNIKVWFWIVIYSAVIAFLGPQEMHAQLVAIEQPYNSNKAVSHSKQESENTLGPFFFELKAAYFYPTNHRYRKIYSGSGLYGLEIDWRVYRNLYAWTGVNALYSKGHSESCRYKTDILQIPVDLGLKYIFNIHRFHPYVGAGILATYMHIHDHASFVKKKIVHWGVGGIFKTGVIIDLPKNIFMDFFTNYSLIKVSPDSHRVTCPHKANLSGFSFGGGLGYHF